MHSLLTIIVFICGHTNGNVVYETEWLHIPSKMKVCQMYHSPFQSDACLELDFHLDTANDLRNCLTLYLKANMYSISLVIWPMCEEG